MIVEPQAVFIGANKQPFAVDYHQSHEIAAFGAGNNIALWKANTFNGIYHTLKAHTKQVTCIRFLTNGDLISGGEDSAIHIWAYKNSDSEFIHKQSLLHHQGSITCVSVVDDIFVTGSSHGEIIIWRLTNGEWNKIQEISVKQGFYPLTIAIQQVRPDEYVIGIGGTSSSLFIYTFATQLQLAAELTGHEDWIKCLAFIEESQGQYILASGSQDRYIRLWRLRVNEMIDSSNDDTQKLVLLSNKQYKFNINATKLAFSFEALIVGHDDWITGLQWTPNYQDHKSLQLLSSSADTALMIWEMDPESGIWICVSRLGELSIKGASTATGASGGFWSVNWYIQDNTQYILTSNRTGSVRKFKNQSSENKWESVLGITGPTKAITDIRWSVDEQYIMVTSLDQTTRLIAPWNLNRPDSSLPTWHEFARPQIHGYDMICLDNISSTKFVSAGDEKILRVFEMTNSINKLLNKFVGTVVTSGLPDIAALPVLGLSNKAAKDQVETGDAHSEEAESTNIDIFDDLLGPPLEDHLQRFTLFPELEKLYGHGYEITNCVVSPNRKLIATTCKTNSEKHGMIRLFNITKDLQQCTQTLAGHNLTITNLEFSADGKYLLSVSRDRQFIVWEIIDEQNGEFKLFEINNKAHSRIIWDCSWLPNKVGPLFMTGSRDKQLKLWKVDEQSRTIQCLDSIKLPTIITAISSYPQLINDRVIIATGMESGEIKLIEMKDNKLHDILTFDTDISPSEKVSILRFNHNGLLACGSVDSSIRIYKVYN